VKKKRFCFLYKNQYFELDQFETPPAALGENTMLLEIKLVNESQKVELPPFLQEIANVTKDPQFKNQNLASDI